MTEVEQPPQNGIDLSSAAEDDDNNKSRPADIEQDMREMERRKRVEAIMGSKLFREELERIVDSARDGGILQQLSDIMGVPTSRVGTVFKSSNCMLPINDIRGVESMGYAKGEKILRCKLAATFRLLDLYGWTQGLGAQITARLKVDQEYFLVNPYGLLYHEMTASSLNKVDMQGQIVEQGTTNFGVNKNHFMLHSVVHAARPDIRCIIYIGCSPVVAVSSLKTGLLPLTRDACVLGEITTHQYTGTPLDTEERDRLVRSLGPISKVLILSNYGALCCGETIEEAFHAACHIVQACETQLKLLPVGLDNLVLIPEESRKVIYEQSRRPPEDLEKKFAAVATTGEEEAAGAKEGGAIKATGGTPKWRVGGAEFEALMRMLDNAGYRTGYIYRHPLIKSDPPKPKNDVELPPAVSSLGYLLEEEELLKQGIWKKGDFRKGGDRSRWLNSPNVYQKVEVLETGTPDPKKITKWVAEGSPTHSTPVRIEDPLQFVPAGTNPKEFKRLQQQIKDNRRADKISAGPQSHILEGVTWDEANRIKDATVSSAGDHVVLMGAASKGIIQRGYQHNAQVYKAPYAKNPFDNVTDDELNEYKRTVERKKKSIHGEYTDTDFSESEPLSSLQTTGAQQTKQTTTTTTAAVSQSEPETVSEHQVMRIETKQAPVPSQPEVVLSDATLSFLNGERTHTAVNRKPPTGRDYLVNHSNPPQVLKHSNQQFLRGGHVYANNNQMPIRSEQQQQQQKYQQKHSDKENIFRGERNSECRIALIHDLNNDMLFQRQKHKHISHNNLNSNNSNINNTTHSKCNRCCSNLNCVNGNGGGVSASEFVVFHPQNISNFSNSHNYCLDCHNSQNYLALANYDHQPPSHASARCRPYDPYSDYDVPYSHHQQQQQAFASDDNENVYKKSLYCCTPAVCDSIFEELRRPHPDNNLIFNIPFTAESPRSNSTVTTPRKARADMPLKQAQSQQSSSSPYRTLSHFGFNSPQREPQPEHKHIPANAEPKKYLPVRKSISYEEIFSSPRYVDLCENCFEKIVRLKPELGQLRATHLRNLADCNAGSSMSAAFSGSERFAGGACSSVEGPASSGTTMGAPLPASAPDYYQYDYVDCFGESNDCPPPYSSQLEPLLEVEEIELDRVEDPLKLDVRKSVTSQHALEKSASHSSFIEKIMSLNYSEESANANFTQSSRTVSSDITVEMSNDLVEMLNTNTPHMKTEVNAAHDAAADKTLTDDSNNRKTSVTAVWEFVKWSQDNETGQMTAENRITENAMPSSEAICLYYEKLVQGDDAEPVLPISKRNDVLEPKDPSQRLLMTREERSRRKLVFQELWEDHIYFMDSKEQNTLSDTESAIDGKQQRQSHEEEDDDNELDMETDAEHQQRMEDFDMEQKMDVEQIEALEQSPPEQDIRSSDEFDEAARGRKYDNEQEIFVGRSYILKKHATQLDLQYNDNDYDENDNDNEQAEDNLKNDARDSGRTYNVSSDENSFSFRDNELASINIDGVVSGVVNEIPADSSTFTGMDIDPNEMRFIPQIEEFELYRQDTDSGGKSSAENVAKPTSSEHDENSTKVNESYEDIVRRIEQLNVNESVATVGSDKEESSDNESSAAEADANQELNPVERKILRKIKKNQLKETAEIFDKIETTILNKLTNSKMEELVKNRQQNKSANQSATTNAFASSTPSKEEKNTTLDADDTLSTANLSRVGNADESSYNTTEKDEDSSTLTPCNPSFHAAALADELPCSSRLNVRRSRSLTPLTEQRDQSPVPYKLNKTTSPPQAPRKSNSFIADSQRSTGKGPKSATPPLTTGKRNFILENIRNASIPRGTVKRLQGNTQAIFGRNPFGLVAADSKLTKTPSSTSSLGNSLKSSFSAPVTSRKIQREQNEQDDSPVYSFQSKSVRGSPRFWVTLSQVPTKKLQAGSRNMQKRRRKHQRKSQHSDSASDTVSFALERKEAMTELPCCSHSVATPPISPGDTRGNVECEIESLGQQLGQLQPRLESYKRKLDDYSDHVAKCSRHMDECMAIQSEIAENQQQMREDIIMNQYAEQVTCDVQTYSISEAED